MAIIADAIVSKVVDELSTLAIEELNQEVRLVVGVKDEVKNLIKNLQTIQAVLADAEQKQLKDASIKLWLDDLKEISYEMDDVLDEWRSAMLMKSRDQVEENNPPTASSHTRREVCNFIPSSCFPRDEIGLLPDIARKIKELNESLNDIVLRGKNFDLVPNVGVGASERVQRRTNISDINIAEVKGRGDEIEKIVSMLLCESSNAEPNVPRVISIVGMGGLGKTTLAQLVYNDDSVKEYFDARIWVCVSDPFDEIKVARAILESFDAYVSSEIMQTMMHDITEKISDKKFLLVLDDVCNEDSNKWKILETALAGGLPGSTILITTRKEKVAKIMGCAEANLFRPAHLSEKECWSIISSDVLSSGITAEKLELLQDIGIQIANKCKGLPIAAKALGGLLRFRVSKEEWQNVLDSEMWQLGEEESEIEKYLFAPLWLSYQDLSPAERQCLSYCASLLKDTEILKDHLIQLWMAQDYVRESKYRNAAMVGEEYFRNFCARSFFQDFQKDYDGEIWRVKMHDIVHDFVHFISKKECLNIEFIDDIEDEELDHLHKAQTTRHLTIRRVNKFPASIFSFKKLRSLAIYNGYELDLHSLFNELTRLRSLVLVKCNIIEIPSTIGKLVHLRLLDLRRNDQLGVLPEEVGDLCNLLVLDLRDCDCVYRIPRSIEKLSNLRYLCTEEGKIRLTRGFERFDALREASFSVDGCADANGETTSLGSLKNMTQLSSIRLLLGRRTEHVDGAKQAQLDEKKYLTNLDLSFDILMSGEKEEKWKLHDEEVLEALRPCSNLKKLRIAVYLGANPNPSWLLSLNHLTTVTFSTWTECNCLPPLGKLPSLVKLRLGFMLVKRVGLEFLGIEINGDDDILPSVVAFPKLEMLEISFYEWEEWEMDGRGDFTLMPRLMHLSLTKCNKLKILPDHLLQKTTLKFLRIRNSRLLNERYRKLEGVDWPKISHIPEIFYI